MRRRGLGFRPDRPGAYPSHRRMGALAPIVATPSLVPFRSGDVYQNGFSMCWASATKRAIQLWHAVRGIAAPAVSDRFLYAIGRAQEFAGRDPDSVVLEDGGTFPELGMLGAQKVGIVPEDVFPGPESRDLRPGEINALPGPDVLCHAYDARGLQFHELEVAGGFRESIAACLLAGLPVLLAVNADGIVAGDPGARVVDVPARGQNHMVVVLDAADPGSARLDNWWHRSDDPWGDQSSDQVRGTWRCSWASLDWGASNIIVLDMAPLVRRSA